MFSVRTVTAGLLFGFAGQAFALCGGPLTDNNFLRPVDYTDPEDAYNVRLVERYHFTHKVEVLEEGEQGPLPGDIEYTLKHIPNHYRALYSMGEWQRANPAPPEGTQVLHADCYFERAFEYKPRDPTLFLIYGIYLHKRGDLESALITYERGVTLNPEYAELQYNLGLLLFDLERFEESRATAELAYDLGYPLPGLRTKLERAGKW